MWLSGFIWLIFLYTTTLKSFWQRKDLLLKTEDCPYPGHEAGWEGQQRADGQNDEGQLPAVNKADDEAGEEGCNVLEEERNLVSDAVLYLVDVTARQSSEADCSMSLDESYLHQAN